MTKIAIRMKKIKVVRMSYRHSIIYKPVCGNCGEVIHGTVSSNSWQYKGASGRGVWPTYCPNCKTYFSSIVMPHPTKDDFEIDMDIDYTNVRGGQHE
jgi:hypothetical protein